MAEIELPSDCVQILLRYYLVLFYRRMCMMFLLNQQNEIVTHFCWVLCLSGFDYVSNMLQVFAIGTAVHKSKTS